MEIERRRKKINVEKLTLISKTKKNAILLRFYMNFIHLELK